MWSIECATSRETFRLSRQLRPTRGEDGVDGLPKHIQIGMRREHAAIMRRIEVSLEGVTACGELMGQRACDR